eukprot:scaffold2945_cov108-Skeletonema_dohrnii-CCMP3373.AAC.1
MFKIHSKASRKFENPDSSKPAQFSQLIVRSVRGAQSRLSQKRIIEIHDPVSCKNQGSTVTDIRGMPPDYLILIVQNAASNIDSRERKPLFLILVRNSCKKDLPSSSRPRQKYLFDAFMHRSAIHQRTLP